MHSFRKGLVTSCSIALGYFPAGATFGVLAVSSGFNPFEALSASVFIFAGASQFALLSTLSYGLLWSLLIPLLLNLRHVVYGVIMTRKVKIRHPLVTAFGLTDEVFVVAQEMNNERFLWGVQLGAYFSWVAGTAVGIFGGRFLFREGILTSSMVFSLAGLFLVLLIPRIKGFGDGNFWSAIAGGIVALIFHLLGYTSWGIIAASVVGPLFAVYVESRRRETA
jgi:4-azaleucine resistance transporter AzlC